MVRMGKTRTVFLGCSAPFAEAEPTLSGSLLVVLRGRLTKSALTARRYTAANMQEAHDLGCKASRVEYARAEKIHSGWHAHCAFAYSKYAHHVCYCYYNRLCVSILYCNTSRMVASSWEVAITSLRSLGSSSSSSFSCATYLDLVVPTIAGQESFTTGQK